MYFTSDPLMDELTFFHNQKKKDQSVMDLRHGNELKEFAKYVTDNRYSLVPEMISQRETEFLAVSNAFGGEAGELQNIVKKIIRSGKFCEPSDLEEKFVHEAGDALHYLISLIQLYGYTVEQVMTENIKKLEARKQANLESQKRLPTETPVKHGT